MKHSVFSVWVRQLLAPLASFLADKVFVHFVFV